MISFLSENKSYSLHRVRLLPSFCRVCIALFTRFNNESNYINEFIYL